ncbi:heterokaryon incompatibility protein-domain-containing protein [Xylariaceae sp. FL1272]|nr:heterokaryon incompatibility protein-domain-containing protein [Xylariaceae sp. FL1272]
MRLLRRDDAGEYSLTPDLAPDKIPPYAILSHVWGTDEVDFADLANGRDKWQGKAGHDKIRFSAEKAGRHGLQYFWIDTCCIDKSNSTELATAINSMFRWYRDAKICFAYLSDVSSSVAADAQGGVASWEMAFQKSRWFTRGWTLQELLAPATVEFYSAEGTWLGDKQSLEQQIRGITGIPLLALRGADLSRFSVEERFKWAETRKTTFEEDWVYCLFGIFDVFMPLIYGEDKPHARRRLEKEIAALQTHEHNKQSELTKPITDSVKSPKCGESGHDDTKVRCYKCGEYGHYANEYHCDKCDGYGHDEDDLHCYKCGEYGHITPDHYCGECEEPGHDDDDDHCYKC